MMSRKALVSGVTGQVASYLAEYLYNRGYEVHGLDRRKSFPNDFRLNGIKEKIVMHEGDVTDYSSISTLVSQEKFDEVYNLAAQSHVFSSFNQPTLTFDVNTLGVLNLLESIRVHSSHTKFYQSSSSELFGLTNPPQNECSVFHPRSPYGVSKLSAHWLTINYHESYKLRASCGIMFNTESYRRGENFVTKKITNWVLKLKEWMDSPNGDKTECPTLQLGNLDAYRDWIHAIDAVDAIYRICNQDVCRLTSNAGVYKPYVFGSGKTHSVRYFLSRALEIAFDLKCLEDQFRFVGQGLDEQLIELTTGLPVVRISKEFYRPAEVNMLQSDPSLIKQELGWKCQYDLDAIIGDMLFNNLSV